VKIFRSIEAIAAESRPSTVTVGSFDGIHRAHRQLLRRVRVCARRRHTTSVAVTFDPHPITVLAPHRAPPLLTPLPIKLDLLARSGVDRLLILPFTREFSGWPPERFVEEVLVNALRAESVVVGENFRFGHKHAGTPQLLEELGRRRHFRTEIIPGMKFRGRIISSSQVRALLEAGRVSLANRLLGHPHGIRGPIHAGRGIGRKQTVPTFNLGPYSGMLPREGVYVTLARLATAEPSLSSAPSDPVDWQAPVWSNTLRSVTNVGRSPTFGERELGVETHLIENWEGFEHGESPSLLDIRFCCRLRDERKFDSPEQLKAQILRDVQRANSYFRRTGQVFARRRSGV
jgi:riboflavin kinase/FMN adenylyltransferase